MKFRVLSTSALHPDAAARMAPHFELRVASAPDAATLREQARGVHAIIARNDVPPEACEASDSLVMVARHGAGLDVVPMAACNAAGVAVTRVPGGNARSVAEYCVSAMLALARRVVTIDRDLRRDGWAPARRAHSGQLVELHGKVAGIIGYGAIGAALAAMLHHGFGMQVVVSTRDPSRLPDWVRPLDLPALCAQADFLLPCVELNDQTRGMLTAALLGSMKPQAYLVNAARGEVLDQDALVALVRASRLAGAALDVVQERELPAGHPLLALEGMVLSPHLAGHTADANRRNGLGVVQALEAVFVHGQPPEHLANPEAWPRAWARLQGLRQA